jgi:ribosomal protein L6P/L9E
MKDISSVESLTIPEGVTVAIKSRIVTVEGPRGKLVKNVGHVQMDIQLVSGLTTGMTVKQRIGMDWGLEKRREDVVWNGYYGCCDQTCGND